MLAQQLGRPLQQVKDRLARPAAPWRVGILATDSGVWPWLYPARLATEWLETTPGGETIYDAIPEGATTVAELARRYGVGQSGMKKRLAKPDAPVHFGRLRAASHPRLYWSVEVDAHFLMRPAR